MPIQCNRQRDRIGLDPKIFEKSYSQISVRDPEENFEMPGKDLGARNNEK